MKANWIDGRVIRPTTDGEYIVIIEVQKDFPGVKKGDVEITTDYFYTSTNEFYSIGDESIWKVLYWTSFDLMDIPQDVNKSRIVSYFGNDV